MLPVDVQYRVYLLRQFFRLCIVPPIGLFAILSFADVTGALGRILTGALLLASIPAAFFGLGYCSHFANERRARSLGAVLAPEFYGGTAGNADIFLRALRGGGGSGTGRAYIGNNWLDLFRRTGSTTCNMRVLGADKILTMDDAVIKAVLATSFQHFEKGSSLRMRMESFLGNGIFNRDGDVWKMHRAMTRPFFAKERISDFNVFDEHSKKALDLLESTTRTGPRKGAIDAQDLYARFTLDTASEFLFGHDLNTLAMPLPIAGEAKLGPQGSSPPDTAADSHSRSFLAFVQAFESAQLNASRRARLGDLFTLVEAFHDESAEHVKVIRSFLDPLVERAVGQNAERKRAGIVPGPGDETTLLDYMAQNTSDKRVIRDELLNILLASRDTTAALLTFTTYLCAMHPEAFQKMRDEAMQVCGPTGQPSYEVIRQLKYMRAVLNETLRLYPPVPFNGRATLPGQGIVIPPSPHSVPQQPLYIPPDTNVTFAPFLMHRRKDLWGDDAESFVPERWIDPERLARFTANPMIWVPFNAGPRICLGQQFAYNEASVFLVRLLQRFSAVELAPDCQPKGSTPPEIWKHDTAHGYLPTVEQCWPASALTLFAKGGLWVRFTPAE
ncbi:cytochrome P450 [Auricularia subglabra TFB-10046 SS5]|uniref:Cytochrome P450 n=1 Tax=Auricularia subglabra (strain TFB-10046 / SS5) TaxID=717982 RepID=J0D0A8_AURST|nr:cytochrome P450 [Auricularia subglabra TFB-10046 SS5]